MANYFLAKTDPDTYSLTDLEKEKRTIWDGVHNYQAIAAIKKMMIGDLVFVYHSQTDKAIVGLMQVVGSPFQNEKDKRHSWAIEVEFIQKFDKPVTLKELKELGQFDDFLLIRNGRLSTMGVPQNVADWLVNRLGL